MPMPMSLPTPLPLPPDPGPRNNALMRRLQKELSGLKQDPPEGCTAEPDPQDFYTWHATIQGPADTPYEGGVFRLQLRFPTDYPFRSFPVVLLCLCKEPQTQI